jgi:hypothetical protein
VGWLIAIFLILGAAETDIRSEVGGTSAVAFPDPQIYLVRVETASSEISVVLIWIIIPGPLPDVAGHVI